MAILSKFITEKWKFGAVAVLSFSLKYIFIKKHCPLQRRIYYGVFYNEAFCKNHEWLKAVNYVFKKLYHRCLVHIQDLLQHARSWICLTQKMQFYIPPVRKLLKAFSYYLYYYFQFRIVIKISTIQSWLTLWLPVSPFFVKVCNRLSLVRLDIKREV